MDALRKKTKGICVVGNLPLLPPARDKMATEFEIRDTIAVVRAALAQSHSANPNIWAFFSNKNDKLLTVEGDLYFITCVLLEGDCTVSNYFIESSKNAVSGPHIVVTRNTGNLEVYSCKTKDEKRQQQSRSANEPDGTHLITLSERDLAPRMAEFANWLMLSGAMTRTRNFSTGFEVDALLGMIRPKGFITFRECLSIPRIDPALMLAGIAKGLATGAFVADTSTKLLDLNSAVHSSASTQSPAIAPLKRQEESERSNQRSVPLSMPQNRRTLAYPELFANPQLWLNDQAPEIAQSAEQRLRSKAVQLYLFNRPYSEIQRETGLSPSWVRKLFRRTLQKNGDRPIGLTGLVRYRHSHPYRRKRELPKSNIEEGRKGGFAGAFANLVARYDKEFIEVIEAEVLRKRKDLLSGKHKIREARVTWADLHGRMKNYLRSKGVGDDEYPFNTRDVAYSSLVTLCNAVLFNRPIRWIESRGGKESVLRAHLGSGNSSLISAQWLNQFVELDYQKSDSAAIIEVHTPNGTTIDVPTARWWAGAIVEGFSEAIIATSDSFEVQTTEDCLMELLNGGISVPEPIERLVRIKNCSNGAWLPSQMFPEYAGQAWDVLKLDRAWAHRSTTALSAVISTVGCAICYGAPRAWFARHLVERTFEKLTQAGPQNLPSTLGTGPKDTRKNDPDSQALRYRFLQDDVCDLIKSSARWLNETGDEGIFWATPVAALKAAMEAGARRYFPRPLPRARDEDNPLMWHTLLCTVEGNAAKGVAPCVRACRTRFRGPALSKAWHLVGRDVYLQIFRRDMRRARVLLANTGELVGNVRPEDKWMSVGVSWRDHALIQKFGQIKKRHERSPTPVHDFLDAKQEELAQQKTKITQKKRDATAVARIMRNAQRQSKVKHVVPESDVPVRSEYPSVLGPAPMPGAMRRVDRRG